MQVVIGIDPHKASHTAVAIDGSEDQISSVKVRATRRQVDQLVSWAEPFEKRTWAIESAGGLGYLLAQSLVARGEEVLDVPATLASRIRVLANGRIPTRTTPTTPSRLPSRPFVPRTCVASRQPTTQRCCDSWLSATGTSAVIGLGWSVASMRSWPSSHRAELPRNSTFLTPSDCWRRSRPRPRPSRSVTTLPSSSSMMSAASTTSQRAAPPNSSRGQGVGHVGHRALWSGPDHCGTAHRLRRRHPPLCQPRHLCRLQRHSSDRVLLRWACRASSVTTRKPTAQPRRSHGGHLSDPPERFDGRAYFERKVAQGKTKKEAVTSLKRQVSNSVYRQLVLDAR